mmetsp:Transcript_7232/g.21401  ORF Transcript_7232/g.21401 Transcript_7232/m.21401 type:complete len:570 (+) Transcript_7232:318-2027(+)
MVRMAVTAAVTVSVASGLGGVSPRLLRDGDALAHLLEQALGALVLLLLAGLRVLRQHPGLLVLRVDLQDPLDVAHAVGELVEPELGLGAPVERLHVARVDLQHLLAGLLGVLVLLELEVAGGLVQLAHLLQVRGLLLGLVLEVVHVAEEVDDLLVALEGHLYAALLEEVAANLLARQGVLDLLLLGEAPGVLRLLEVLELQREHDRRALRRLLEADLRLGAEGGPRAGHVGDLALLHLHDGELDAVAHLAAARRELEGGRGKAGERLLPIRRGQHLQRHLGGVLGRVPAVSLHDLLLHHGLVLQERHVLRLEEAVERQLHLAAVRRLVAEEVVLGDLDHDLLLLLHAPQRPVGHLRERAEGAGAQRVLHLALLEDDLAVRGGGLDGALHLVPVRRRLPAGALFELVLDGALVAEEVVLGHPADELDLEDQRGVRRDRGRGAGLPVGEVGGEGELGDLALLHAGHADIPALDDLPLAEAEDEGLAALARGVEAAPVRRERADVVHRDLVALLRAPPLRGLGLPDDLLPHALRQRRGREAAVVVVASVAPVEAVKVVHGGAHVIHGGHLLV